MTSPDPENRAGAMAELRDYIDVAARLRATDGVVIGWVKGNRRPEDPDFDRLLAEQLSELGEYAGQRGQTLLVEVISSTRRRSWCGLSASGTCATAGSTWTPFT